MSPYTNFHAPRTSLSGRIQIGHKSGYFFIYYYYLFSVNIKPSRHCFGFSLAWDWQLRNIIINLIISISHNLVLTKSLGSKHCFKDFGTVCLNSGFGPKLNPLKESALDLRPKPAMTLV